MALPYSLEIQKSISSALLLRVQDTDTSVLNALYTSAPEVALRVFLAATKSPAGYLDALKQALHGSSAKPSRDVIRAHLSFLLSRFVPAYIAREQDADAGREFLRQASVEILLPFLLYTKPRMKTAQAVWEILQAAEDAGTDPAIFELLGGCVEAVRWEQQRAGVGAKEKSADKEGINVGLLTKINIAVAAKIAGACFTFDPRYHLTFCLDNIIASNYFQQHLDSLLAKLHDDNHHARALAYLVARTLLSRVGSEQRVDTAYRILQAMRLETLEGMGDFMRGVDDVAVVSLLTTPLLSTLADSKCVAVSE